MFNFNSEIFQVRRGRFGPEWECGDMISIGLWVGILVTLGFALICAWGFSMLASINVSFLTIREEGEVMSFCSVSDHGQV